MSSGGINTSRCHKSTHRRLINSRRWCSRTLLSILFSGGLTSPHNEPWIHSRPRNARHQTLREPPTPPRKVKRHVADNEKKVCKVKKKIEKGEYMRKVERETGQADNIFFVGDNCQLRRAILPGRPYEWFDTGYLGDTPPATGPAWLNWVIKFEGTEDCLCQMSLVPSDAYAFCFFSRFPYSRRKEENVQFTPSGSWFWHDIEQTATVNINHATEGRQSGADKRPGDQWWFTWSCRSPKGNYLRSVGSGLREAFRDEPDEGRLSVAW